MASFGVALAIYVREDKHDLVSGPCEIGFYPKSTQPGTWDGKGGIAVRIPLLEQAMAILNVNFFHASSSDEAKRNGRDLKLIMNEMKFEKGGRKLGERDDSQKSQFWGVFLVSHFAYIC
jgi:hypothetical protein